MSVTWMTGDVREQMRLIPDGSVSLIATSPPFWKLRSYLPSDHESKLAEIGSEPSPAEFIDTLLELTAEWGRVLAPWGSIAIELGDTYSGAGGYGNPDSPNPAYGAAGFVERWEGRTEKRFKRKDDGAPLAKSLVCISELYAIALAYGINPLTGAPSPAGQWLVRNRICWHRPNPAVGALGDKFRPSTSYITVATRARDRFFDLDAVRQPYADNTINNGKVMREGVAGNGPKSEHQDGSKMPTRMLTHAGAPPLDTWFDEHDTWTITTQPSKLAHYAMWPPKLAERLILSMCPAQVCGQCGAPRRRMTKVASHGAWRRPELDHTGSNHGGPGSHGYRTANTTTLGWSDCGHDNYVPGVVLDPFAGTGTTLAVAHLHGRDAIGIDIDGRNADLYPARLDECKRALFGTLPEMAGQLDMFGESA